jgi:hypothetical protein
VQASVWLRRWCGRTSLNVFHLAGSLKETHSQYSNIKTYDVEVRTLDEFPQRRWLAFSRRATVLGA